MTNIFFTSDTHYSHKHLCLGVSGWDDKSGCRNFSTLEEMNKIISDNINKTVGADDILWHLGDFALGPKNLWRQHRDTIKCKNIFKIKGNHTADYHALGISDIFSGIYEGIVEKRFGNELYVMCHYPILSWNHKNKGAIHLFAHCHGNMNKWLSEHLPNSKMMDVGIDTHPEFRPYHINEIRETMKNKSFDRIDHHNE